jgi:hypothetical protein
MHGSVDSSSATAVSASAFSSKKSSSCNGLRGVGDVGAPLFSNDFGSGAGLEHLAAVLLPLFLQKARGGGGGGGGGCGVGNLPGISLDASSPQSACSPMRPPAVQRARLISASACDDCLTLPAAAINSLRRVRMRAAVAAAAAATSEHTAAALQPPQPAQAQPPPPRPQRGTSAACLAMPPGEDAGDTPGSLSTASSVGCQSGTSTPTLSALPHAFSPADDAAALAGNAVALLRDRLSAAAISRSKVAGRDARGGSGRGSRGSSCSPTGLIPNRLRPAAAGSAGGGLGAGAGGGGGGSGGGGAGARALRGAARAREGVARQSPGSGVDAGSPGGYFSPGSPGSASRSGLGSPCSRRGSPATTLAASSSPLRVSTGSPRPTPAAARPHPQPVSPNVERVRVESFDALKDPACDPFCDRRGAFPYARPPDLPRRWSDHGSSLGARRAKSSSAAMVTAAEAAEVAATTVTAAVSDADADRLSPAVMLCSGDGSVQHASPPFFICPAADGAPPPAEIMASLLTSAAAVAQRSPTLVACAPSPSAGRPRIEMDELGTAAFAAPLTVSVSQLQAMLVSAGLIAPQQALALGLVASAAAADEDRLTRRLTWHQALHLSADTVGVERRN